jgi:hypothetical protein
VSVVRLVTHSAVEISAPAVAVWPYVLEPNTWKQGLKPERVSGEPGTVGEVCVAATEHEGTTYSLTTETVALEPLRRKAIRISVGAPLDPSWAVWQLQERHGVTTVTYDVYGELEIGDHDPEAYMRINQERFDAELLALKALVEG